MPKSKKKPEPDTAATLLRDAVYLLNDKPRFKTRNGSFDSYEVAARINHYFVSEPDPAERLLRDALKIFSDRGLSSSDVSARYLKVPSPDPDRELLEAIADIANIAGRAKYYGGDSRQDIADFIEWGKEFAKLHRDNDWIKDDYIETIGRFTTAKLNEKGQ